MQIALTPRSSLRILLILALFGLFIAGGIANILPPIAVRADYGRWGYPDWFHYITGLLELACALCLIREKIRKIGAMLGGIVMAGAMLTFLWNGEYAQMPAPAAVLVGLFLSLHLDEKAREARWEGKIF